MHSWCAIGPTISLMQFDNGALEDLILLSMKANRASEPGIKAAARHTEKQAEALDTELIPVLLDKRKNQ
jgi:hypothetical protein